MSLREVMICLRMIHPIVARYYDRTRTDNTETRQDETKRQLPESDEYNKGLRLLAGR